VPFADYLSGSAMLRQRSAYVSSLDWQFSISQFKYLFTLVSPNYFGSPLTHNYSGPVSYHVLNGAYSGIAPLFLALASVFLKKKKASQLIFIGLGLFTVTMVYRAPIIFTLVKALPGFGMTNTPRMLLVLGFTIAVLSAFSVDFVLRQIRGRTATHLTLFVLLTVAAVDLFHFGRNYNPAVDASLSYPETETTDFLNNDPSVFRIASPLSTFPHETHLPYGLSSIRGYDALEISTYTDFMSLLTADEIANYFVFATPRHERIGSPLFDLLNVKYFITPPELILDRAGITNVYSGEANIYLNDSFLPRAFLVEDHIVEPDFEARLALLSDPSFNPGETVVLEENVPFQSSAGGCGTAEIQDYRPEEVVISTKSAGDCFLVLSDNYFSGWKARVDGERTKMYRADHTFRAVRVPAGVRTVRFFYQPSFFYPGAAVSAFSLLILIVLAVRRENNGNSV
jgi:Bacterial membrane protein YfhO